MRREEEGGLGKIKVVHLNLGSWSDTLSLFPLEISLTHYRHSYCSCYHGIKHWLYLSHTKAVKLFGIVYLLMPVLLSRGSTPDFLVAFSGKC